MTRRKIYPEVIKKSKALHPRAVTGLRKKYSSKLDHRSYLTLFCEFPVATPSIGESLLGVPSAPGLENKQTSSENPHVHMINIFVIYANSEALDQTQAQDELKLH